MRRNLPLFLLAATLVLPAHAQGIGSPGFQFLKAVKDRDGDKATELIDDGGPILVNSRDRTSGEGALHIVIERRDATWLGFLLQKGANPNLDDRNGVTPLMLATQYGWLEGIDWLLRYKADVDRPNRGGETALIRAVQLKNHEVVRALLKAGADPDRKDSVAGLSARDYAERDGRSSSLVRLLQEEATPRAASAVQGPVL